MFFVLLVCLFVWLFACFNHLFIYFCILKPLLFHIDSHFAIHIETDEIWTLLYVISSQNIKSLRLSQKMTVNPKNKHKFALSIFHYYVFLPGHGLVFWRLVLSWKKSSGWLSLCQELMMPWTAGFCYHCLIHQPLLTTSHSIY